jgi:serine/threonine protein kinase
LELLTGDAPWGKLNPMAAIFHIVQDDLPPIPKGITESLFQFLLRMFDKNYQSRASARVLMEMDWIKRFVSFFLLSFGATNKPILLIFCFVLETCWIGCEKC